MLDACECVQAIVAKHYPKFLGGVVQPFLRDLDRIEKQLTGGLRPSDGLPDAQALAAYAADRYRVERVRQMVILKWRRMERLAIDGPGGWFYEGKPTGLGDAEAAISL